MNYMGWRCFAAKILVAFVLSLSFCDAQAQQNNNTDTLSLKEREQSIRETFHDKEKFHSPHKATFYSAILPGLGQAYNKKYWKIPIVYGAIGGTAYALHFNTKYYNIYKNAYRDFLIRDPGNKAYEEVIPPTLSVEDVEERYADWFQGALENKREYYKRYRDLNYIIMAGVYILNMIDASVDAHFYDFDVSDDLSMNVRPVVIEPDPLSGNKMGLQLSFRF